MRQNSRFHPATAQARKTLWPMHATETLFYNEVNDQKKYFNIGFKTIIASLSKFGFKKYKTSALARILDKDIFQCIGFQKSSYGSSGGFTVHPWFLPLYIPGNSVSGYAGNRLGYFYGINEKWWHYESETQSNESFLDINHKLHTYVMPWFEKNNTSQKIKNTYEHRNAQDIALSFDMLGYESITTGAVKKLKL